MEAIAYTSLKKEQRKLVTDAENALKLAYAPYSKVMMGAAVLTENNEIFTGARFEEASYHHIGAIQAAIGTANAYGHKKFKSVAIVAESDLPILWKSKKGEPTKFSTGAERQLLVEAEDLSGKDLEVIHARVGGIITIDSSARALLPNTVTASDFGIDLEPYRKDAPRSKTSQGYLSLHMPQDKIDEWLLLEAKIGMENAYSPYSKYKVGSSMLMSDGRVVIGANFETAAANFDMHGEQTAIAGANSLGKGRPIELALIARGETFSSEEPGAPCGNCRQTIIEAEQMFGNTIRIIDANTDRSKVAVYESAKLLPGNFGPLNLGIDVKQYRRSD